MKQFDLDPPRAREVTDEDVEYFRQKLARAIRQNASPAELDKHYHQLNAIEHAIVIYHEMRTAQ